jgi:hypothetical protein
LQLDPIKSARASVHAIVRTRPQPLPPRVSADDRNAHRAFVDTLGSDSIWFDYSERDRLLRLMVAARR